MNYSKESMGEPLEESTVPEKNPNPRVIEVEDQLFRQFAEALPDLSADQVQRLSPVVTRIAEQMTELENIAVYDTLLRKFFRHQNFLELLQEEAKAAEAIPPGKLGSVLIFMDLDNFKAVNDILGHQTGDELLRTTGDAVLRSIRPGDTPGRVGGEELAVIIRRTTIEGAVAAARRIQTAVIEVSQKQFANQGVIQTVSIGICPIESNLIPDLTLVTADKAMYVSKANGKNRITIAQFDQATKEPKMIPVEPIKQGAGK